MRYGYKIKICVVSSSFFSFCFLSFVDSSSSLKIICWLNFCLWIMKINFSFEDLRNISNPPPCHVKHLKLSGRSYQVGVLNLDALVDGLLWSCRPETLSTAKASAFGTKLAKVYSPSVPFIVFPW